MSMNIKALIIAVFSALTTLCFAADVEWLNAADGAWGVGANWNGGTVPNSARAVITNDTSSFTVSVTEATNPTISGLLLNNTANYRTNTVHVTGQLSSRNETFTIGAGGLLHLDGGTLAITNSSSKTILLSGASTTKNGAMKVSDGLLDFRATSVSIDGGIQLGNYGLFEATGGKIRLTAPNASNSGYWGLYCIGIEAVSSIGGTAEVEIANRCIDLRCGSHILKDCASFVCTNSSGNDFSLKANSTRGVTLTIQDSAELDISKFATGYMGNYYWANKLNKSTMNVAGGIVKLPGSFVVGDGNGTSEMNISGGATSLDFYGFDVGAYQPVQLSKGAQNPVAKVNVSGGSLVVSSRLGGDSTTAKQLISGLIVGNGSRISTYHSTAGYSCVGTLNVSGGVITNGIGLFVVGAGRATGNVLQTGGSVSHGRALTTDSWRKEVPMIVGFAGGTGTYVMSNGVTSVYAPVYVGGVVTNVLNRRPLSNWPGPEFTDLSAVGRLVVAGGRLSTLMDLVVGADGSGMLEIGPSGTISVGTINSGNVVLSNRVESVTRFVLGADGAGQLTTQNALIVAEGARLEVDVSDYVGTSSWVKLINCSRREGSFAAADISVVGRCARGKCEVVQNRADDTTGSVWLHVWRGTIVNFL